MAFLTVSRLLRSMKHLSLTTTIWIFFTFSLVIFASFLTPFFLRFLLLPKTTIHEEHLDFTFRTCDDQLSGVCSYPEAILDLNQLGYPLSPGYYYALTLKLELFDSDQNQKLGIFQAQITAKDENQKVLSSFKKPLIFRKSFFSKIYVFARNTIFFPLYLIGYFDNTDTVQTVLFTSNFYESSLKPTTYLIVQIQNRFVQVASAFLEIRAIVGFSAWLFNDFPIISFFLISTISFMANFCVFMIYWSIKGIVVYVEEEEIILEERVKPKVEIKKSMIQVIIDIIRGFIPLKMTKPVAVETRPKTPEPSPLVWNVNEVPESQKLEDFFGFENIPDVDDIDDAITSLREQLENHTTNFDGPRKRRVKNANILVNG
uniref:Seipin n=1 Tax=Panagrolaimus sp. JU765 TaxID=591449 RepID=A0AC34QVE0_9BILA